MPEQTHSDDFFQASTIEANFVFWAKQPTWTGRDAAALFCGLNPERVLTADGMVLRDGERFRSKLSGMGSTIERGLNAGEVSRRCAPSRWVDWALMRGIPIQTGLIEIVREWDRSTDPRDEEIEQLRGEVTRLRESPSAPAKAVGTRERESMLKLILGMAIGGYAYNPSTGRNTAIKDIETDLATNGLSLSDDTIRTYLQEASTLLEKHNL